jgi:hypothetical protein
MSSLDIAVSPPIHRDETVQISLLPTFRRRLRNEGYPDLALARGSIADRLVSLRDTTQ